MGKFAIVTGASTGIGRAIAVELAKRGYYIALCGRTNDKLLVTKDLITKQDGKAEVILGDFSNLDSLRGLITTIKERTGKVDVLVNVAGIWHGKDKVYANIDFQDFSEKIILNTYSVGLTAPTLLCHAFVPMMPERASIINISGTFESGAKGWLPYYVSKRALEDLTIGLSEELKNKRIKVNCISPSDTATEEYKRFFPNDAKNAQTPEDVAHIVKELVEGDETGQVWLIKQGQKEEKGFHK